MMSTHIRVVTDATFESELSQESGLSILDFWAEWCTTCHLLGKTLEGVAEEFVGRVTIFKMNAEENPHTPLKFRIRGLPAMVFFRNGQVVDQVAGNPSKSAMLELIQKHL
jgi:thioredoxin 1